MEVLRQKQPSFLTPPRPDPRKAQVRIWFWNNAGAQTLLCPTHEAADIRQRLLAEGAIVWHTEVHETS